MSGMMWLLAANKIRPKMKINHGCRKRLVLAGIFGSKWLRANGNRTRNYLHGRVIFRRERSPPAGAGFSARRSAFALMIEVLRFPIKINFGWRTHRKLDSDTLGPSFAQSDIRSAHGDCRVPGRRHRVLSYVFTAAEDNEPLATMHHARAFIREESISVIVNDVTIQCTNQSECRVTGRANDRFTELPVEECLLPARETIIPFGGRNCTDCKSQTRAEGNGQPATNAHFTLPRKAYPRCR